MDKLTINIIKQEFIGTTIGHFNNIPNNPRLLSLLVAYQETKKPTDNATELFEDFICELAESIKNART